MIYPFLIVSASSSLVSEAFNSANQILRHVLVWGVAVCAVIEHRSVFSNRTIFICGGLAFLASGLAGFIWFSKTTFGAQKSILSLYNAFEPVAVILCAAGLSLAMSRRSHLLYFSISLLFWIATFGAIHVLNGFELHTGIYGRLRWTFGFVHPGKAAQLVAIALLGMIVIRSSRHSFKSPLLFFVFMIISGAIIILTNTRAMIVVYVISLAYLIGERVRSSQKKPLLLAFVFIFCASAAFLFFGLDKEARHFLLSGRIAWLLLSVGLNFGSGGVGPIFWGVFDEPVGNHIYVMDNMDSGANPFRVDNGYLETVTQHGLIVLVLLISVLVVLARASTKRDFRSATMVAILAFFLAGEAGLFAVGNFFGLVITTLAMLALRAPRYQPS